MASRNRSTKTRKTNSSEHAYERLEQKNLLASITADLSTGTITVEGSSNNDAIVVSDVNSYQAISVYMDADGEIFDPADHTFNRSDYHTIVIRGLAGNDSITNSSFMPGDIYGGDNNDTIRGGWSNDLLRGGNGNDTILGFNGNDTIWGGDGDDVVDGGFGNDIMNGMSGNDTYQFSATSEIETDYLFESGGNDSLVFWFLPSSDPVTVDLSSTSPNYLIGNHTGRQIRSSFANQFENVTGGHGNDFITGNSLSNQLSGFNGNDTIDGEAGNDTIWGGTGNDTLSGGFGTDILNGESGDDTYKFEGLHLLYALDTDWVYETSSTGGTDTLDFSALPSDDPLDIDLSVAGNALMATALRRNVRTPGYAANFENVIGGAGNDTILGNAANNRLEGGAGDDYLRGAAGADDLFGDSGVDNLFGGYDSADDFLSGGSGMDRVLVEEVADSLPGPIQPGEDALLYFIDYSADPQDWTDAEINHLDTNSFDLIAQRTNNNQVLAELSPYSGNANGRYFINTGQFGLGLNAPSATVPGYGTIGIITISDDAFSDPVFTAEQVMTHEIAHTFHFSSVWNDFVAASGWTTTNQSSNPAYTLSGDQTEFYLSTAEFATIREQVDQRGRDNRYEDWASMWEEYFYVSQTGTGNLGVKLGIIDDFFQAFTT